MDKRSVLDRRCYVVGIFWLLLIALASVALAAPSVLPKPSSLAYSVDGGQTQLSEAAVMRVYRPTFLGITKEDWNGIFWASLLLLVTVVCLYAAVRSDHDKEDYCYD